MKDETFAWVVEYLEAIYGERLEGGRLRWWQDALGILDDAEAVEACRRVARTCDRFKMITPAVLIKAARGGPSEAAVEEEAASAWGMVAAEMEDIRRDCPFGVDRLNDASRKRLKTWFDDDEIVERVVNNLGGLWFLLQQEERELHTFTRREFLKLYAALRRRESEEETERVLAAPGRATPLPAPHGAAAARVGGDGHAAAPEPALRSGAKRLPGPRPEKVAERVGNGVRRGTKTLRELGVAVLDGGGRPGSE